MHYSFLEDMLFKYIQFIYKHFLLGLYFILPFESRFALRLEIIWNIKHRMIIPLQIYGVVS